MARRPVRVLPFPVARYVPLAPCDREGQLELFPEPEPPDPNSPTLLILHFTELQILTVRLASDMTLHELLELHGEYWSAKSKLEAIAVRVMRDRELAVEAWHARVA